MTNFCGYDISPDMARLSRVNMYLHGFANPRIHEYDTLTNEERWDERYDIIMANSPFMTPKGGIRPHNRFSIKAKRSEMLFVDTIAEHLNPNGRAALLESTWRLIEIFEAKIKAKLDEIWGAEDIPGQQLRTKANGQ